MAKRMYVIRPRIACGLTKCVPPWDILLYSIIMRAARRARMEVVFRMAWMCVPNLF